MKNFICKIISRRWLLLLSVSVFILIVISAPYNLFKNPTCTLIDDSSGQLLGARIANDGQWRFPGTDIVPDKYAKALLVFEDKRFYIHSGVDGIAICRALLKNIKNGRVEEGGSTITMQVVRMTRKNKRTIYEKIIEAVLATRIEMSYKKSDILSLYASNAPFGSNVVGINAAAWRYFGRDAGDLSWAEAALLAVLPNAPSLIHPGRNRTALKNKRDALLDKMHKVGIIDEEICMLSKQESIPDAPLPLPRYAPHLLDRIAIKNSGQRVKTTLHQKLQQSVNDVVENHMETFRANKVNNAAVIVADVNSGEVLAYVGNAFDANKKFGTDVDIIQAPRSTGSILKPFLYAAMLDEGELLPNMLLPDIPLYLSGFSPSNYSGTFDGAVPAHLALERSLNVPAVRMLYSYGVAKFHALLKDLGMTTITKRASHYGLSLILGGAEGTLWDITAMYADMARIVNNFGRNSGRYNIHDYKKLRYIKSKEPDPKYKTSGLIGAAALYETLESLSELNRPEEEASWKLFSSGRKISWKTGTSYGNRDAWAVGVNTEYVVGVWVGNASGEGRPMLTGVGYAGPLLFDVFNLLSHTSNDFKRPYDEMVKTGICRKSGHKVGEFCTEIDSIFVVEKALESPPCPYHIKIHLDKSERYRVNSSCYSASEMISKSWFVLPPAQEWYYRRNNPNYLPLPPFAPNCINEGMPMQIIYPAVGVSVMPTKQMDGSLGVIILQAAHNRSDAIIFWYIDDKYIGQTVGNHSIDCTPSPGTHTLTLTDDIGNVLRTSLNIE